MFGWKVNSRRPLNRSVIPLVSAGDMPYMLQWPNEFDDPTPVTGFEPALEDSLAMFFMHMIANGATVSASETWMSFALSRETRTIEFIRRGVRKY